MGYGMPSRNILRFAVLGRDFKVCLRRKPFQNCQNVCECWTFNFAREGIVFAMYTELSRYNIFQEKVGSHGHYWDSGCHSRHRQTLRIQKLRLDPP